MSILTQYMRCFTKGDKQISANYKKSKVKQPFRLRCMEPFTECDFQIACVVLCAPTIFEVEIT